MWDRIWEVAIGVCGLGAVGAFVFWSLYKQWLRLPIFSKLTRKDTFVLMLVFLGLSFLGLLALLALSYASEARHQALLRTQAEQKERLKQEEIRREEAAQAARDKWTAPGAAEV